MNAASKRTLLAVGACAIGVAAALGWATAHALRLERREIEAQAMGAEHESIRLALWRMDSALTPILARETARPYFQYSAFYPSERAYTSMLQDVAPGEHLVASPLLTLDQQFVKLYFQRSALGELTSPQVPTGDFRDLVEAGAGASRLLSSEARLGELSQMLTVSGRTPLAFAGELERYKDQVAGGSASRIGGEQLQMNAATAGELASRSGDPGAQAQVAQSAEGLTHEYQTRQQLASRSVQLEKQSNLAPTAPDRAEPSIPAPAEARAGTKREGDAVLREDKSVPRPRDDESRLADKPAPAKDANEATTSPDDPVDRERAPGPPPKLGYRSAGRVGAGEQDQAKQADQSEAGASDREFAKKLGSDEPKVEIGDMIPVWRSVSSNAEPQLLLVRTVRVGDSRLEQGCWLDWPALRTWLLSSIQDLLPGATLRPVLEPYAQADPEALGRRLAGVSAELQVGPAKALTPPAWTPMRTTLVLTWLAVLLAFGLIGAALLAARELAERRGQFVSAVTHELRTPLTTFCLYSQMLADGMVTEESSRRDYLGTLRSESERLTRIVESVLEYARIGRGDGKRRWERASVSSLMNRILPSLRDRASRAGVDLDATGATGSSLESIGVEVDPVSVERILGNLVDNACKYAPGSPVKISVEPGAKSLRIYVRDQGPGIPREQRARLFQPFERGRSLAHATTPGLGLGLALSRELARRMGGDLELLSSSSSGSTFVLSLARREVPAGTGAS